MTITGALLQCEMELKSILQSTSSSENSTPHAARNVTGPLIARRDGESDDGHSSDGSASSNSADVCMPGWPNMYVLRLSLTFEVTNFSSLTFSLTIRQSTPGTV